MSNTVKLFHGSHPDNRKDMLAGIRIHSQPTDFAPQGAFYTTPSKEQACFWALSKSNMLLETGNPGLVFELELDLNGLSVHSFSEGEDDHKEWQKLVSYSYMSSSEGILASYAGYDVIIGPTSKGYYALDAPPQVIKTMIINGEEMIQYALISKKAISQCRIVSEINIEG